MSCRDRWQQPSHTGANQEDERCDERCGGADGNCVREGAGPVQEHDHRRAAGDGENQGCDGGQPVQQLQHEGAGEQHAQCVDPEASGTTAVGAGKHQRRCQQGRDPECAAKRQDRQKRCAGQTLGHQEVRLPADQIEDRLGYGERPQRPHV